VLAPHYQCVLTREGPLDELTVHVEAGPGLHHEHEEVRSAADRLAYEIKVYIGTSARIEVRPPGGIERSMGKARRVVDQRKL
jgi:phenylacetate-CoA ligase